MSNRLQNETSPYLLQHAHNPVDWFPWGEEAFSKARSEDKPILVSIGYSTCHWCHVMERESFEDSSIAAYMNQHFVNIKLDREEHPEIDQIYMEAVQLLTGGGGWPLNCFLLPDLRPFYGGTYYPPVASYNRPSWRDTLHYISNIYKEKKSTVEGQADRLTAILKGNDKKPFQKDIKLSAEGHIKEVDWQGILGKIKSQFDLVWGGMGGAPKFPSIPSMKLLLYLHFYLKEESTLSHLTLTLDKMIIGGIHDVVGGGFARYATDTAWRIPHFEKMLYDNAQILDILSDAFKTTGNSVYLECAKKTIDFLQNEMRDESGLYYAALDADSEGVEGKFYTWNYDELNEVVAGDYKEHFFLFHCIEPDGNWEGTNILYSDDDAIKYADEHKLDVIDWKKALSEIYKGLLDSRNTRVRPHLDHKILLSWNALLASALLKWIAAAPSVGEEKEVTGFLDSILETFLKEDFRLFRLATNRQKKLMGNLDDYAYLIEALILADQIIGREKYLSIAERLTEIVFSDFSDDDEYLFYFTSKFDHQVPIRKKEIYDHALPSANAMMCKNIFLLGTINGRLTWVDYARKMNNSVSSTFAKYPSAMATWIAAALLMHHTFFEVEILGKNQDAWKRELLRGFLPNKILSAKVKALNKATFEVQNELDQVLICKDQTCEFPYFDLSEAIKRINKHV